MESNIDVLSAPICSGPKQIRALRQLPVSETAYFPRKRRTSNMKISSKEGSIRQGCMTDSWFSTRMFDAWFQVLGKFIIIKTAKTLQCCFDNYMVMHLRG